MLVHKSYSFAISLFFIKKNSAAQELERQLDRWLSQAELLHGPARAVIAP